MSGSASAKFLGPGAEGRGPFSLLGLPPAECGDDAILEALRKRLAQVDAHAQSESPQADEARLALHAAAAQLLDPSTRRHLLARWAPRSGRTTPGATPSPSATGSSHPPGTPRPTAPSQAGAPREPEPTAEPSIARHELLALEHDAILVLAQEGGWSRRSLRKLAMLAHSRGIRSESVASALGRLTHRKPEPGPTAAASPPRDALTPGREHVSAGELPPPGKDVIWPGVLFVCLILGIGLGIASVALFAPATWERFVAEVTGRATSEELATDEPAELVDPAAARVAQSTPADPGGAPSDPPAVLPDLLSTPSQIVGALSASSETLGIDAEQGGVRFTRALEAFAGSWTSFATEERIAAMSAVVEFLYRASTDPELGVESVRFILEAAGPVVGDAPPTDAERVRRAAWAVGALQRIAGERDLGLAVATPVRAALSGLSIEEGPVAGDAFERGAAAALEALATDLRAQVGANDQADGWRGWLASAIALSESADLTPLLIGVLSDLLRYGPDPAAERWVFEVIDGGFALMDWAAESPARAWFVGLFDDPDVAASDLRIVTQVLAASGDHPAIDSSMVLPVDANELTAATIRDRYKALWDLVGESEEDQLAAAWSRRISEVADRLDAAREPMDQLAVAAELAALNHAAVLRWRGSYDEAARVLGQSAEAVEAARAQSGTGNAPSLSSEVGQDWAVRYLEVGNNLSARLALLDEVVTIRGALGPMAAEVLVHEACRGNRQRVRAKAHEMLGSHLFNASVVNALLETLPDLPPTRRNLELVERVAGQRLPPSSDPRWAIATRRALVERLLSLTAGETALAEADRLEDLIALAYAGRLRDGALESATAPADRLAAAVRLEWSRRASRGPGALSEHPVERRRLSRRAIADGPMQVFLVEQLASVEWMALVVQRERPEAVPVVDSIRRDLDEARRGAGSVFGQVAAAEWAMLRLWSVRLNALQGGGA